MEWIILSVGGINSILTGYSFKNIPQSNFLKKDFVLFLIITSLWIYCNFFLRFFGNFFWFRLSYAIGSFITPSALILVMNFSIQKKISNNFFVFLYSIGGLLFLACFIDNIFFIKNNYPIDNVIYKPLFLFYSVFLFSSLLFAFYKLLICIKKFKGLYKLQALYIFIGLLLFGLFSLLVSYILPTLGYAKFAKLDTCGLLFFVVFTLYAIVRYHLMGINIIIKKSAIHTFMIAFTTIAYITVIFIFENILNYFFQYNTIISRIFAGTIIALTFLPVHNKIKSIIDKILFKNRGEYLQSIKDFSQNLITILDLRQLLDTIADNIRLILNAKHAALFLFDDKDKTYRVNSLSGYKEYERIMRETLISKQSSIVCWLQNNKNIEIKSKLIKEDTDKVYTPVINQMEELNAELIMPLFFDKKLIGLIILGEKKDQDMYNLEEINLLKSLANQVAIAYTNASSYNKLKKLYLGTVESFIKAIEAKDKYTIGHSYRVISIALKIGMEYGLSREDIELLKYSSVLHDIGNIAIPDNILTKPDKLTKKEFDEIKKHPVYGKEIISSIEYFNDAGKIIMHHHEHWDGKGYPYNVKGEQIPLLSRIIFIAEVFDALTSERSYRPPLSKETAVKEIQNESGKKFDPELVECFISAYNKNLID